MRLGIFAAADDDERQYEASVNQNTYIVGGESNDNEQNLYGNKYYMEANFCYYSETPNADGSHWHYNEQGLPEIWTEQ